MFWLCHVSAFSRTHSSASELSDTMTLTHFYRTIPSEAYQSYAAAYFIAKMGWSHVTIVAVNNAYGLAMTRYFVEKCASKGISILATIPYIEKT
jgi:ABC-type branched-subunit amino acid transport system substrate-binding protein